MRNRPKLVRNDRRHPRGLRLAIDHGQKGSLGWPLGSAIILVALAAIVTGFIFARSRIQSRAEESGRNSGPPYIPGTTVRFGEDQPAHVADDDIGEAIDPDRTEVPAPEAQGREAAGGAGDADAE